MSNIFIPHESRSYMPNANPVEVIVIDIEPLHGPLGLTWCVTLLQGNRIASQKTLRTADLGDNEWDAAADAFKVAARAQANLISAGYSTYIAARYPRFR
jgi:hypothetical protein